MPYLRRLHAALLAYIVKWLRVRYVLKQFKIAHAQELTKTPVQFMPVVLARQQAQLTAIRAGNLNIHGGDLADGQITDRKSWQWPFLPSSVRRLQTPIMKMSPYNLRRMSRTPVPRRAMNKIKGAMISLKWEIRPVEGVEVKDEAVQKERIKVATKMFNHPNNDDSFQTFLEQGLEDYLVLGAFVAEMGYTVDPHRPMKLWPVNVESIRLMPGWMESTPDMPRYVQMTGLKGERGALAFYDDDMLYLKDNPSTDNPFGLGKMEVAFQSVNDFLGVQGMSGRAGTDQVHKTWLWWEHPQPDSTMQIVRRHIQNDLEGQAKISLIGGAKKPEVLEVNPVTIEDLLIPWQEMLIRMIANGFDMSAMALGIEHDINRAVGQTLSDEDFRTAVVPTAKRIMEGFTRRILHSKLHWHDLEFWFVNLDDPDMDTMLDMFSRLYAMNGSTPNEARKKLNLAPLDSPLADMTQQESMILMLEAQDLATQKQQERQQKQQQDMMQQMQDQGMGPDGQPLGQPQMPGQPGQPQIPGQQKPGGFPPKPGVPGQKQIGAPGGGGQGGDTASRYGQMPNPKPLALPKFPMPGIKATAKQVAMMPVNQVQDLLNSTGIRPSRLLKAMDQQEPGILQQLSDDVKQFLEQRLAEEQAANKSRIPPKMWDKWQKDLQQAKRKGDARTNDLGKWMREKGGQTLGRPGTSPGKPGTTGPKSA